MAKRSRRTWPDAPEALPRPVIDNHTHLDAIVDVLDAEAPVPTTQELIAQAQAVGVQAAVQVGCDLPAVHWVNETVLRYPELLGAVALHPNEVPRHLGIAEIAPDGMVPVHRPQYDTSYADAFAVVVETATSNPRIRAIGETGLDLFRTADIGLAAQIQGFRDHIALAKELNLALQIHDRDAHAQVIEVLERDGAPERTVFHCFSGDADLAEYCGSKGWYLSFAGPVTFRANTDLREALHRVPPRQILVETDAPYLTPHPYRGHPNAPYLLPWTVRHIATELVIDLADFCDLTVQNTVDVYGAWDEQS